jgi:hypothetical protein
MKPIVLKSILIFVAICFFSSCHKAIVIPANTVSAASSTPSLEVNTTLSAIYLTTTGATGIGVATGLPAGVTARWTANMITISGTPTECGTFNYKIPLTGGSGTVYASGTIIVHYPICDYLPLKVGAKYLYSYYFLYHFYGLQDKEVIGKCEWEFFDRDPTNYYVFRVRQTLNDLHNKNELDEDTTLLSNRIDTLTFQDNITGTVTINWPNEYSGTVERYFKCSKNDTCFVLHYANELCLIKNVGVGSYSWATMGNFYWDLTSYSLDKGPY